MGRMKRSVSPGNWKSGCGYCSLGPELRFGLTTSEKVMLQMCGRLCLKSSYILTLLVMYHFHWETPFHFVLGCLGKLLTIIQCIVSASCPKTTFSVSALQYRSVHQRGLMLPNQEVFAARLGDSASCSMLIKFHKGREDANTDEQISARFGGTHSLGLT